SAAENNFVHSLAAASTNLWIVEGTNSLGPWLGASQPDGSTEPAGGWAWITGESWTFTNWSQNQPNNSGGAENAVHFFGFSPTNRASTWNDLNALPASGSTPRSYTLEIDLGNAGNFLVRDAAVDFSLERNPNPPWTYGWSSDLTAPLSMLTEAATVSGLQVWRRPGGIEPVAVFNPTGADIQTGTPRLAAGKFHVRPGPSGEFAVLRFTCPVTGLYEVVAAFEGADTTGQTDIDARIRAGTNQLFQAPVNGFGPASRRTFRTAVALAAGTSLDFAVGPNGASVFDSTLVDVQVRYRRTFQGTTGAIDYPGEQDTYTFRLAAPATLYFDAQTQDSSLNWTLTGPPGLVVNGRTFGASDADNISDPLLRLPAGDYTLTIRGANEATGPYQFALLDLADAALIQVGTTNGNPTFARRTTDLYQFTANSGDIVTFDRLTAISSGLIYWRLFDPYARPVWQGYFNDVNNFTLPATGTYTLMLESFINGSSPTSYTFRLVPGGATPPPAFTGTPLTFGTTISNVIATAGSTNAYTFSLPQKTFLYFDSLMHNSNLRYTLLGPGGIMASTRSFSVGGANNDLHEAPAGDYQLVISGANNFTGPFVFRLLDLSNAQPLTLGSVVVGTNFPASSLTPYRFNATPGTRLFFDALGQSGHSFWGNCNWTLVDPYGNILFADAGLADRSTTTLTGDGTYTIWVAGGDQEPGPAGAFSFNLVPVTESSTALALNTEYSGSVALPGQRHLYTFTLTDRKRVYFQSLTNQSLVRWSLDGPQGNVAAVAFNAGGWLAYTLEPGDYRLSVFANGDDTGGYWFKIVDFDTSIPTPIGPVIDGTLAPARTVVIRDLDLVAGDRMYFDTLSQSGFPYWGNPFWRVEDPEGNAVFLPELNLTFERSFGDVGPFTVQRTARYRFLIGGGIQETGAIGNYSFRIHRATNSTETIAFNQTVQASINTPGQLRIYTFTLAAPTHILMDNLQPTPGLRWMLTSADQVFANNTAFNSSAWNLYNLPAGVFQLTVSAPNDDLGSTTFRLVEPGAAATPMALNTDINTTLTPITENKVFKFAGQSGQRVYFDLLTQNGFILYGHPFWLLIGPQGEIVFEASVADRGPILLPETGEYQLVLSGHTSEPLPTGSISFRVNDAPINSSALSLNALTSGVLAVPGESHRFTFVVNEPTQVIFDSRTNSPLRWTLSGPSGVLLGRAFNSSDASSYDSFLALAPVAYTLEVTGNGDDTGGYAFLLRTLASAELLPLNTTVNGSLDPASGTWLYRFNASAGDRVRLQQLVHTGMLNAYWRLRDPVGDLVWYGYFAGSTHSNQLDRTGTYTLQIEGSLTDTGTGTFTLSSTTFTPNPPPSPNGTPFAIGQTISNALPTATAVHSYLLTITQPTRLYLDYLRPLDGFSWALLGSNGPVYRMHSVAGSLSIPTLPPGSYELQWTGVAAPYAFRMLSVDAAPLLTLGTAVTNQITPASGASIFRVPLVANQSLYFDLLVESGFSGAPSKTLEAPAGHNEFYLTDSSDEGPFAPRQSGEHILILDGTWNSPGATGTLAFALNPVGARTNAATLGATLAATLPAGGGSADTWTFSLPEPTRLFVDVLNTPVFNWEWSVAGPSVDDETTYRSPTTSDGIDSANSSLALGPGNYQLRIRSTTTVPSSYSLRLLRPADAASFELGSTVAAPIVPGSSTTLLRFNGVAGQPVYYDYLTQTGPNPALRLYSPSGKIIQSQSVNADLDTFQLPLTGEYILSLEGRYNEPGPGGTNTFVYHPINHVTNNVTPDQLLVGTITAPGTRHFWNFSIAAPQLIWVDALTNAPGATWTLSGGLNTFATHSFTSTDGIDLSDSALRLAAGDYTLTVALGNNNTGTYALRLVSPASAAAFTLGTANAVTIDPPQMTRVLAFNGNAGNRYYFDGLGHTGGGTTPAVRLYAPNGDLIVSRGANENEPTFTLPLTGAYYFSVEGRILDTGGPRVASFALIANPP
ncbi:MAG TPA: hypothetical protein VJS65_08855, partial [Verrucomicrobiae bacterium]|nr:hypothetical protein [Verrucomicrobiae bacterium]